MFSPTLEQGQALHSPSAMGRSGKDAAHPAEATPLGPDPPLILEQAGEGPVRRSLSGPGYSSTSVVRDAGSPSSCLGPTTLGGGGAGRSTAGPGVLLLWQEGPTQPLRGEGGHSTSFPPCSGWFRA